LLPGSVPLPGGLATARRAKAATFRVPPTSAFWRIARAEDYLAPARILIALPATPVRVTTDMALQQHQHLGAGKRQCVGRAERKAGREGNEQMGTQPS
jgi:hypothetical protein